MWCADCESIENYFFANTNFFVFAPTTETVSKISSLCDSFGIPVCLESSHCLSFNVGEGMVDTILMSLYGTLNGPERANTKATTVSFGEPIGIDAIGRILPINILINRYKSQWITASVESGRYESWFQPIVFSKNRSVAFAHEALFRIRDESETIIPPDYVFSIAADSDLLFSLDLTARRSAIEHAQAAKLGTKIFVNFDPSSIYDPSYCLRSTAAAIDAAGLKKSDVVFEVTETHKAKDLPHLKGILNFYRNAGFEVALDDIGSGWSGLNLLHDLMPDYAKIDMELIRGIDTTQSKQRIVKHLIASAKENGIRVIAEGIETQSEADILTDFGADYLQGYLFGKPEFKPGRNEILKSA